MVDFRSFWPHKPNFTEELMADGACIGAAKFLNTILGIVKNLIGNYGSNGNAENETSNSTLEPDVCA